MPRTTQQKENWETQLSADHLAELMDEEIEVFYEPKLLPSTTPKFKCPPPVRASIPTGVESQLSCLVRIADALERLATQTGLPEPAGRDDNEPSQQSGQSPLETMLQGLTELAQSRFQQIDCKLRRIADDSSSSDKEFYTLAEAADRCNFSKYTLRQACNTGRIDGIEKGEDGRWRISHDTLKQIQEHGLPSPSDG